MLRLFRRDTSSGTIAHDHLDVAHEGAVYRVSLKRVTGARRYTLRVRNATRDVVITMPTRGTLTAARDFAQRHAGLQLVFIDCPQPFHSAKGRWFPFVASTTKSCT
jgi:hypothetical protein